jgi:hypothetical protein
MALKRGVLITMFLWALKRAVPRSGYAAEFCPELAEDLCMS